MSWPTTVDAGGWMRKTERRIGLLERKPTGSSSSGGGGGEVGGCRNVGEMFMWTGAGSPGADVLECDGSFVDIATYPDLYAVVGTKYLGGSAAQTGKFRLPQMAGRVPIAPDGTHALGSYNSVNPLNMHTLTIAELAAHTHASQDTGGFVVKNAVASGSNFWPVTSGAERVTPQSTTASTGSGTPFSVEQNSTTVKMFIQAIGCGGVGPGDVPLVPIGAILEWPTNTIPAGYLLCDGSAVSRTTYADLFAAIGTTYGIGDNSTTFNLPNKKGRVSVGRDAAQTEFDVLGETGGTKTETLTIAQLASHTHGVRFDLGATAAGKYYIADPGTGVPITYSTGAAAGTNTMTVDTGTGATTAAGSGSAHNNLQPYIVTNFVINATNKGGGGGGSTTTIAVQDTATLDLTLTGTPAAGYTLKGDVLGIPNPTTLAVTDTATLDLTLTGTPTTGYNLSGTVLGGADGKVIPAGVTVPWSGTGAVPSGWLLADGSAVSRTVYSELFAAIGTTYGVGDNSTTFNVPNLKGKTTFGQDAAQAEFTGLGGTGGEKSHTLSIAEMPAHTHIQNAHNHTQDAHEHEVHLNSASRAQLVAGNDGSGTNRYIVASGNGTPYLRATPVVPTNQAATATNQNTGGGSAHNVLPPYIVQRYLISIGKGGSSSGSRGVVGEIMEWPVAAVPQDHLLCDGSAVSRTTYADLFAVISTTYGIGDNSTTFNLPDMRGRVAVGLDGTQTEFNAYNKKGGEKVHALSVAEIPQLSIQGGGAPDGGNQVYTNYTAGGVSNVYGGVIGRTLNTLGTAHNVLQPYVTMNFVIRYRTTQGVNDTKMAVTDTATIDLTLTGDGSPVTPFTIKADIATAVSIPAGTNITSTYVTPGYWEQVTPANATIALGYPVAGVAGRLEVTAGPAGVWQRFTTKGHPGRVFVRDLSFTALWTELAATSLVPPGSVIATAGGLAAGYLWCSGSAVSRTTYADLFAAIGTTYGVGDNSTTFNLPNLLGRVIVMQDGSQTEFATQGKTGGEKAHVQTINEMASHNHTLYSSAGYAGGGALLGMYPNSAGPTTDTAMLNRGGGAAANVLQPYLTLNYMIKA